MYTHRALVTYSNERTGEIRVKVPAITGKAELSISYIGRHKFNEIWIVPNIGEQIVVSADDEELTNLFWVHTDGYKYTKNYRNYAAFHSTNDQVATIDGLGTGIPAAISYQEVDFSKGIRLVDNTKITFDYAGTYNLQYSIQWRNTDTKVNESVVWLKYKGINYADSASYVTIPESHGGVAGKTISSVNVFGEAEVNGYVELWWAGSNTAVSIHTITAGSETGLPSGIPRSPGVILTVDQIA